MVKHISMLAIKRFFMPSFERNIPKFFIYQALYNFMLFLPVWVIFLQQKYGLSLTQVTLIDSAFWLTMVFTEVPTGAVADTLGRKYSQVTGSTYAGKISQRLGEWKLLLFFSDTNFHGFDCHWGY